MIIIDWKIDLGRRPREWNASAGFHWSGAFHWDEGHEIEAHGLIGFTDLDQVNRAAVANVVCPVSTKFNDRVPR